MKGSVAVIIILLSLYSWGYCVPGDNVIGTCHVSVTFRDGHTEDGYVYIEIPWEYFKEHHRSLKPGMELVENGFFVGSDRFRFVYGSVQHPAVGRLAIDDSIRVVNLSDVDRIVYIDRGSLSGIYGFEVVTVEEAALLMSPTTKTIQCEDEGMSFCTLFYDSLTVTPGVCEFILRTAPRWEVHPSDCTIDFSVVEHSHEVLRQFAKQQKGRDEMLQAAHELKGQYEEWRTNIGFDRLRDCKLKQLYVSAFEQEINACGDLAILAQAFPPDSEPLSFDSLTVYDLRGLSQAGRNELEQYCNTPQPTTEAYLKLQAQRLPLRFDPFDEIIPKDPFIAAKQFDWKNEYFRLFYQAGITKILIPWD